MRQLTLILLFALTAACGQKGLLYIPDPSSADTSQNSNPATPRPNEDNREEQPSPDNDNDK